MGDVDVDGVLEAARRARARVVAGSVAGVEPCFPGRLPFGGLWRGVSGEARMKAFVGMSARREKILAEKRKRAS